MGLRQSKIKSSRYTMNKLLNEGHTVKIQLLSEEYVVRKVYCNNIVYFFITIDNEDHLFDHNGFNKFIDMIPNTYKIKTSERHSIYEDDSYYIDLFLKLKKVNDYYKLHEYVSH